MPSNVIDKPIIEFIIPTVDNQNQLLGCLQSLFENSHPKPFKIYVANNGIPKILDSLNREDKTIEVIDMGENKGWEGGINAVLDRVESPITCLLNDDTHIPPNDPSWLLKVLAEFKDPSVGAVGPSSNYVMQKQNMFWQGLPRKMNVPVLVGFCLFIRTELLKKLGGLGKDLPGGDDLDLSMKLTAMGYKLRCLREVFVYHHGASTGRRIHGAYWDSEEHQDKTNIELIRRNGLKSFMNCRYGGFEDVTLGRFNGLIEDSEGTIVRDYVQGQNILELGCGDKKTVPQSVGVDVFPKGETIPSLTMSNAKAVSVADIVATVDNVPLGNESQDTIIARHIFEHVIDPVIHLREWDRLLKFGGRIIFALPDQDICSTIPLNPEHLHAYNKMSFDNLVKAVLPNYETVNLQDSNNGMSFVAVYEKKAVV